MRIIIGLTVLILQCGYAHAVEYDADMNPMSTDAGVRNPSAPASPVPDVQVFYSQADFLAAAGPVTTEDFEDEPLVGDCDSGAQLSLSFDHFDATSDPAAMKLLGVECVGNHNTTPGGAKYLAADTDLGGVSAQVTLQFYSFLHAFGMYVVDLDSASLEVTINGNTYTIPPTGNGGQGYFGIVSTQSFTEIEMIPVTAYDSHYSLDDVAYGGGPVSVEPASWAQIKGLFAE